MPTSIRYHDTSSAGHNQRIGQLAAVDKKDLPSPYTNPMMVNLESCNFMRAEWSTRRNISARCSPAPSTTSWEYMPRAK